jgi:CheY-like chemotaxis protein
MKKKSDLIENKILSFFAGKKIHKKYQILILEDDDVYVKNFSSLISSEDLNEYFNIESYSDYDLALKAYYEIKPEYIICDIDLGLEKLNGFDFVNDIRNNGCVSKICIHTNRFFKCDLEKSINVKSDFFIAKPMSRFQFLRFLCSYILPGYSEESFLSITSNNLEEDKIILLIDDEDIYHKFWEVSVTDTKVMSFSFLL